MIEIRNLKKAYGDRVVLNIPYMKIEKGEKILLTGHNGSGKSTLLKILAGVITDYEGEITLGGEVAYLPQQSVPFRGSLRKNIMYAMKGDKKEKKARCDELIDSLSLGALADKNATGLSGGECQRLCLARVMAVGGDVLLLDEPTSAADRESTALMEKMIVSYCEEKGCTLLMTTHSEGQPERIGGKIINLCDGERTDTDA